MGHPLVVGRLTKKAAFEHPIGVLHQVCNMLFPVAIEKVDYRNLYHSVATGSLAHCRTCTAHKHLGCQCRVVDFHIELEELVLRNTRNALTCEVHTVTHIKKVIDTRHLLYVCLVVDEIGVGLDCRCHLIEVIALLEFDI